MVDVWDCDVTGKCVQVELENQDRVEVGKHQTERDHVHVPKLELLVASWDERSSRD